MDNLSIYYINSEILDAGFRRLELQVRSEARTRPGAGSPGRRITWVWTRSAAGSPGRSPTRGRRPTRKRWPTGGMASRPWQRAAFRRTGQRFVCGTDNRRNHCFGTSTLWKFPGCYRRRIWEGVGIVGFRAAGAIKVGLFAWRQDRCPPKPPHILFPIFYNCSRSRPCHTRRFGGRMRAGGAYVPGAHPPHAPRWLCSGRVRRAGCVRARVHLAAGLLIPNTGAAHFTRALQRHANS